MSKKNYSKDDVFSKLISGENEKKKPLTLDEKSNVNGFLKSKVGRPSKIDEKVKKYSYYLTKHHYNAIKNCAQDEDTDFSSVVRNAIEDYAKKRDHWKEY